jgi:Cdc6-like AAA superfamily ATPase
MYLVGLKRALRVGVGVVSVSFRCLESDVLNTLGLMGDIAGVPGTGKTATVHAVVKELKRKAEDGVSTLPFFLFRIRKGRN